MSYRIAVIGTGYVGLVTGTCLADVGNFVLCIDVDPTKVARLSQGDIPIYEPGLDLVLDRNIREKRISFSLDLSEAVRTCEILMFCLPTPPGKDGEADLEQVMATAQRVGELLNAHNIVEPRIIINKSTVPVGTTARVAAVFATVAPERRVDVVSNPEFLREGFAVDDFMKPDRIVVGTSSPYASEIMKDLYEPFVRGGAPILIFDEKSAEVTKYAANAYLATKISFMNDLSEYCEAVGADIEKIRLGIGTDGRIGKRFLFSGIGYGGSCFPKDVKAIIHAANEAGTPLEIVEASKHVNDRQVRRFIDRIINRFDNKLDGRDFGIWGLSFKPNTDDVREAPAFVIIDALLKAGAVVRAYDPEATASAKRVLGDSVLYADTPYEAIDGADALIIATEWNEFRKPDMLKMKSLLMRPLIFDGRNIYDLEDMAADGFEYHSVGRASVEPRDT
ncbi:MAG: UDP-glucose/GDP-mannose dehydrogenase family protein [Candidatus Kapabacteria bacterium]|nr:UDP-glucose/GDP-mannose dehydrogenase family protein [Candidatus Kapabacteria bacterium]